MKEIQMKLKELLNNSYSPYSKFPVSCIVETKDNKQFFGVNIENASYGLTVCAERNAIFNAVSNGYRPGEFKKLYCMTNTTAKNEQEICVSCGACCQVISEFFEKDCMLCFFDNSGKCKQLSVAELIPHSFTKENL